MIHTDVITLVFLVAGTAPAPNALYDREIAAAIEDVKDVHAVPAALVKAVITQESSWNPRAVSRAGALGLMQLLPTTAANVGVSREELFDPARNILAGVRLLAVLLHHYQGDVISALTAYNARPRRLFAPIPQNGETPGYVKAVWRTTAGTLAGICPWPRAVLRPWQSRRHHSYGRPSSNHEAGEGGMRPDATASAYQVYQAIIRAGGVRMERPAPDSRTVDYAASLGDTKRRATREGSRPMANIRLVGLDVHAQTIAVAMWPSRAARSDCSERSRIRRRRSASSRRSSGLEEVAGLL